MPEAGRVRAARSAEVHRRRAERRADRRVEVAVERFGGCLSDLPRRQERVLRLRAGIGPRRAASRRRVAHRLDLSVRQVRRAERRGLRSLRQRCGSTLELPSAGSGITPGTVAVAERIEAAGVGVTTAGGGPADGGIGGSGSDTGRPAERDSGGAGGGVRGTSATAPFEPPALARESPPVLLIVFVVIYLAGRLAYSRLLERYDG